MNRCLNRYRMLAYYIFIFIENTAFSLAWFFTKTAETEKKTDNNESTQQEKMFGDPTNSFLNVALVVLVMVSFFVGIAFLLIYYIVLHPTISKKPFCRSSSGSTNREENIQHHNMITSIPDVITPAVEIANRTAAPDVISINKSIDDIQRSSSIIAANRQSPQPMSLLSPGRSPSLRKSEGTCTKPL